MNTIIVHTDIHSGQSPITVDLHLYTILQITAEEARRCVKRKIIPDLGTGLGAADPELKIHNDHIFWRVPVFLSLPTLGTLGIVGSVDVDALSGEITLSEHEQKNLINHARWLYNGATLSTN